MALGSLFSQLHREAFDYFSNERVNGLVLDNMKDHSYASVAGVGYGLWADLVGIEHGWVERDVGAQRVLEVLERFEGVPHTSGFFWHFLQTADWGCWRQCEVSSLDTALFLSGVLGAREYFSDDSEIGQKIRCVANRLFGQVDWGAIVNPGGGLGHGWHKGKKMACSYLGYNEALFMYILALGSERGVGAESYRAWEATYQWRTVYGYDYLYGGPLFWHQTTQSLIDCRGIRDQVMREREMDYFENSRRATLVQQEYARRRGARWGYGADCFGLTASDGPGVWIPGEKRRRRVHAYRARGAPWGPDDGTVAPWAMVASAPFVPEVVEVACQSLEDRWGKVHGKYGYACAVHPRHGGWVGDNYFAIDVGSVLLQLENLDTGLVWKLMGQSAEVQRGLRRAGFRGGWLG